MTHRRASYIGLDVLLDSSGIVESERSHYESSAQPVNCKFKDALAQVSRTDMTSSYPANRLRHGTNMASGSALAHQLRGETDYHRRRKPSIQIIKEKTQVDPVILLHALASLCRDSDLHKILTSHLKRFPNINHWKVIFIDMLAELVIVTEGDRWRMVELLCWAVDQRDDMQQLTVVDLFHAINHDAYERGRGSRRAADLMRYLDGLNDADFERFLRDARRQRGPPRSSQGQPGAGSFGNNSSGNNSSNNNPPDNSRQNRVSPPAGSSTGSSSHGGPRTTRAPAPPPSPPRTPATGSQTPNESGPAAAVPPTPQTRKRGFKEFQEDDTSTEASSNAQQDCQEKRCPCKRKKLRRTLSAEF
ncbi:hypothetical protein PRZ48_011868 [Zasmidium cellare]|uniref:ENTH domain-containing protein n=1 Tax=Zasmidium cellare TaxID=395010 RepID=A0ABR0E7L5_ZASCE|nr:hypothetical protein PRZ48_011868 [Zasmidium cellare]